MLYNIDGIKLEGNICIFGDSIVWGAWDKENAGWANRLVVYCSQNEDIAYNLGIPADTTTGLLKRIKTECNSRNPDTIIISIGINDAEYLKDIEGEQTDIYTFKKNIKDIIEICREYTQDILFVGLTKVNESNTVPVYWDDNQIYFNKSIKLYNEKIRECCLENNIGFLDVFDLLQYEDLDSDGLHPNEKGHKKIFESIISIKK